MVSAKVRMQQMDKAIYLVEDINRWRQNSRITSRRFDGSFLNRIYRINEVTLKYN